MEVVQSLFLEVFKNHGDVALRDVVSGHGADGLGLELMILVVFSNLNDSVILWFFEYFLHHLLDPSTEHIGTYSILMSGVVFVPVVPECPALHLQCNSHSWHGQPLAKVARSAVGGAVFSGVPMTAVTHTGWAVTSACRRCWVLSSEGHCLDLIKTALAKCRVNSCTEGGETGK